MVAQSLKIYEVGPRDGLQSLGETLPVFRKVDLINLLSKAGLNKIEAVSFVNPKKVPTMEGAEAVYRECRSFLGPDIELGGLVPNQKGLQRAKEAEMTHFNVFFSPDERFNRQNLGKTLHEAVLDFKISLEGVPKENIRVYVSCAFGTLQNRIISDSIFKTAVIEAAKLGSTVVLCDTVGIATPWKVREAISLAKECYPEDLAMHFHQGLENDYDIFDNVQAAIDSGVYQFDSSIGGLGGCPFVHGSRGNLSTEQLVAWAHERGYYTGVNENLLDDALEYVQNEILGEREQCC